MVTTDSPPQVADVERLLETLTHLRDQITRDAAARLSRFSREFPEGPPPSAENLAHYLALRSVDLRPMQQDLARLGISSLGRSEAHVLSTLDQVIRVLDCMHGQSGKPELSQVGIDFESGPGLLALRTQELFGPQPDGREVRTMVTLPTEAAYDPNLVRGLVAGGMNCARINCAHDGPETWALMVKHVREAAVERDEACCIQMDLAGNKVRTGPIAEAPQVVHVRPARDALGRVQGPAHVELRRSTQGLRSAPADTLSLTLPEPALACLRPGDRLRFRDTRGKTRELQIVGSTAVGVMAHCHESSYLTPETSLTVQRMGEDGRWKTLIRKLTPGGFPHRPLEIRLVQGDRLTLTREPLPGRPACVDDGRVVKPAHVSCTAPHALDRVMPGQQVWIDDGKLGGVVELVDEQGVHLTITHSRPRGVRLKADKGLNFPGADLGLPPLTSRDLADLDFVVEHADIVGLSFVEDSGSMMALIEALARRGADSIGIVAKIETQRALKRLPDIIFSAIGRHPLGLMIARGDLAVEIGGERMAEIQEELLWLCEAAHVPVIWGTQVLESLAKKGVVSRPEMTDAAMSGRAECVMLNKGPYIQNALRTLDGILRRMQEHQRKKTSRLRALRLTDVIPP